jgi:cell division protein FtsQ
MADRGAGRRRRVLAVAIAAVLVVAVGAWGLTYTSLFAARHIRIRGNHQLSDQQVRDMARLSDATNVAHFDAAAAAHLLGSDPWIASAQVDASLPNTVVVIVDERRAVGVIDALGDSSLLASDGAELPMVQPLAEDLPVVRAGLGAPDAAQRSAAASLLSNLSAPVSSLVEEVLVGQDGVVTVMLTNDVTVDAGAAGREQDKADAIDAILRWAAGRNLDLSSIDVSSPSAPAVTLGDGSTVIP